MLPLNCGNALESKDGRRKASFVALYHNGQHFYTFLVTTFPQFERVFLFRRCYDNIIQPAQPSELLISFVICQVPSFEWTGTAVGGGTLFWSEALLDALADDRVMLLDWNRLAEVGGRGCTSDDVEFRG